MNKNVKIAKELIKLAKSLISSEGYTNAYHFDYPVKFSEGIGKVEYILNTDIEPIIQLKINGKEITEDIIFSTEFIFDLAVRCYYDEVAGQNYSLMSNDFKGIYNNNYGFYNGINELQLNDDDEIEFDAWYLARPFKGKYKDLKDYLNDENNLNKNEILDEKKLFDIECIQEDLKD